MSKPEKKKTSPTSTMKPMSAHDEKTLNTAVALANEITSKSMNDLDGEKPKYPQSPNDRSKFHFKFPLSLHNHGHHLHEPEKDVAGKQERRNFSEEAKSVPDIQSTLTAESKMAYTSLIEEPTPSTSLMTHLTTDNTNMKHLTVPKPGGYFNQTQFNSLHKNMQMMNRSHRNDEFQQYADNPLPLPPRTTKPKLIDKPRHIRKYPLKIPGELKPTIATNQPAPIIYQNTSHPQQREQNVVQNSVEVKDIDVLDGPEPSKFDTNPFTNVPELNVASSSSELVLPGPSGANPFTSYTFDDDDDVEINMDLYMDSEDSQDESDDLSGALVKDCKDHVSVEDLLEFADQKPCGRQRGVESDEVRIMSKVFKQQVSPEKCLESLELSDWNVHNAIKLVRVSLSVGVDVSLEDCCSELSKANGDIIKASAALVLCKQKT